MKVIILKKNNIGCVVAFMGEDQSSLISKFLEKTSIQIKGEKKVDFIFLHTPNDDTPIVESYLLDLRATALFLNNVQLRMADEFVYVTTIFSRKTQKKIQQLITELGDKKNCNTFFVIHYLNDVLSNEKDQKLRDNETNNNIKNRIENIGNLYKKSKDDELTKNWKEKNFDN